MSTVEWSMSKNWKLVPLDRATVLVCYKPLEHLLRFYVFTNVLQGTGE